MKVFGIEIGVQANEVKPSRIEANRRSGNTNQLFNIAYDGEKNSGELGPLVNHYLDYEGLRSRCWESYLTSEITQTIVRRFSMWVIGSGLRLQSEPIKNLLEENGITIPDTFTKSIENRFRIFSNSKLVDFSEKKNLHQLANTVFINKLVGGDMLVVLRVENNKINIQLIDGGNVVNPYLTEHITQASDRGNSIKNGIEIDSRGRNVAFYVKTGAFELERIPARNPQTNRETAFIVYGSEYRVSDNRGLPAFSAVLETLKKLDRYKEAMVGSAEERAKIVLAIEHGMGSVGDNPMANRAALARDYHGYDQELATDINGKELESEVALTTNKTVVNLPQDSTLKALDSTTELSYKEFYSTNVDSICATLEAPPEVILSKYDSNFSSARAALKDWEHTLDVKRKDFSSQFYQKIYEFWLDLEILKLNIQAEGYINALATDDEIILASYRNARFVGANVPHIDPLKEVNAVRARLGKTGENIPLVTAEEATEILNGGEYDTNVVQYAKELEESKRLGVTIVEAPVIEEIITGDE